ncbi:MULTISPECIES: Crp/Fnr family transcriptional regulator [unclassified Rhizobium]|uniref:Crp/Fnr family transcriptional regulator n=1 Tax=unclassified Rhizobium TaxID=2613769 RepID=UPI0015FF1A95|nr:MULTISPECIES: Crp/Fnr family transcriptional regulator [unclassified Rhizobium]MBB1249874.1 Crp/Fnr family transcriptional regulator [Rhizobium sp. G21]MCV3765800.1 Crp/Fnr family transcriptional regulator [Rhizobium sp. TRM95796]
MLKMNHRDREILLSTPLMSGLNPTLARRVLESAAVFGAEAKDVLFREGAEAENFYVVLSGYVRLFRLSREGKEADIGVYGPGETFGECAMFLGCKYAFNAQAAEPVTLARFDVAKIRQIMAEEPEFSLALLQVLAHHLQDARENVANDRLHTAPQRVANYLLEMMQASGSGNSNSFRLPFQKSLLAGKLGLAPEALSRAFSMLKTSGVSIRGRMVQITDAEALRRI